ncbi:glycosyltransferase family 2 protein [Paracoccus nototheniae]|uniref:Glycosyltransferase family 2 protein n=1 Tax=Paracoccus nototheniae TaxID=2489002 RepID=A0ABW4DYP1_9RHOB|nr:glycosyltransferase family 2 protein [Paracoccus nototheniae]
MIPGSVHVIILNWRSADMTLRAGACAVTAMQGIAGTVTLIDNASGDGSFETMSQHAARQGWTDGGRLRVLQSGRNGGFGAGNNAAMGVALPEPTEFVLVVNSDAFLDPDTVARMRDYLQSHPQVGLLGCRVVGEDGHHHATHFRFPGAASELEDSARTGPLSRLLARHIVARPMPETAGPVDWVAGAALMIRSAVLDRIGGFDEAFFLYYEETDLCLRAAQAGWPTHYLPEARVVHIGSVSTGMQDWSLPPDYWFASREHYYRRNHGRAYAMVAVAAHVAGLGIRRLRGLMGRADPDFPKGQAGALIRHALAPSRPRQIFKTPDYSTPDLPTGE